MEEATFTRELNKYRVVRRPEYCGGGSGKEKKTVPASISSTRKQPTTTTTTTKSTTTPSKTSGFWELLLQYAVEKGMSNTDAEKLVHEAKIIHASKRTKKVPASE